MIATPAEPTLPLRRLTCAHCSAAFDCGLGGRDGGCWCMDEVYRMPMPPAGSGDCLCPACLRTAAASASTGRIA